MATKSLLRMGVGFSVKYPNTRNISTIQQKNELTTIELNPTTAIATLTLQRLPANALSLELMQQVKHSIQQLEQLKCRGIILTSASDRIFCAGLDLNEVYKPDLKRITEFWLSLQNMWQSLFSTSIPTAALINGHAPAGGCLLATCCDYRVMLPNFRIGLNETRVGVAVPKWVIDSYMNVMPSRRVAEADLIVGRLYESKEALAAGLVDDVVESKEEARLKCEEFLKGFSGFGSSARAQTKLQLRQGILRDFEKERQQDLEMTLRGLQREDVQNFVGNYLRSLKKN